MGYFRKHAGSTTNEVRIQAPDCSRATRQMFGPNLDAPTAPVAIDDESPPSGVGEGA
jgi:hypothetical protein